MCTTQLCLGRGSHPVAPPVPVSVGAQSIWHSAGQVGKARTGQTGCHLCSLLHGRPCIRATVFQTSKRTTRNYCRADRLIELHSGLETLQLANCKRVQCECAIKIEIKHTCIHEQVSDCTLV